MERGYVLSAGRWRLKIDFISQEINQTYYTIGTVKDDGDSTWTDPVAMQPDGWSDAPSAPQSQPPTTHEN